MWFTSNVSAVVRRRSLLRGGLILGLLLLSLLILSCPEDDTESPTTSPTPAPEYELRHFQAMRDESQKWCAWLEEEDRVSLNVPHAGEFLVTLVTQQTTLRLVAQVHQASVLILWLQPTDRLVAATAQAGEIHAPGAANASVRSVHEDAYQFPQIWPASPYATLFAWPAHGGIGTPGSDFHPRSSDTSDEPGGDHGRRAQTTEMSGTADAHSAADPHAHTATDPDADRQTDQNAHRHANANTHADADAYGHTVAHRDAAAYLSRDSGRGGLLVSVCAE